jgi:hypothetical protein
MAAPKTKPSRRTRFGLSRERYAFRCEACLMTWNLDYDVWRTGTGTGQIRELFYRDGSVVRSPHERPACPFCGHSKVAVSVVAR